MFSWLIYNFQSNGSTIDTILKKKKYMESDGEIQWQVHNDGER